ncbi:MAG: NAD(P)/FAD-dependent oxidoreductase [Flavobacteriaceae bacterium]|nr:NAD(P)/FAD-dependent oxidoreductase [Flavobacteriaceae bacterium]
MNYDIIIIGAGLSGVGAACHLERKNPNKSYKILEARAEIGGTWSLFKYPGIRSDSDMYTFGYSFKTWDNSKSFADAPSILTYLKEAVIEYKIQDKIEFNTKVSSANFNSKNAIWEITTQQGNTTKTYTCNYIFFCTGYYSYSAGFTPDFKDLNNYKGIFIHPQKWPKNLDYTNKKVVVIGSGATAVTLVPEMAEKTKAITMLQRSPTYVGAFPNKDKIALFLKKILPKKIAHKAIRFKNIVIQIIFFSLCRAFPNFMKKMLVKGAQKQLGDFPAKPHFEPNYKPWDQRFCVAPDGDLFKVLKEHKANIVTDHIDEFTTTGVKLKSGKVLEADIVISATGLQLLAFGGATVSIDDKIFDLSSSVTYRGLMLSDLPNAIFFAGYTNASWTLKSDLTSEYANRLLNLMDKKQYKLFVPKVTDANLKRTPLLNLNSGYIHRSEHEFPKQGNKVPWKLYQNWFLDYYTLRIKSIKDKNLTFN